MVALQSMRAANIVQMGRRVGLHELVAYREGHEDVGPERAHREAEDYIAAARSLTSGQRGANTILCACRVIQHLS